MMFIIMASAATSFTGLNIYLNKRPAPAVKFDCDVNEIGMTEEQVAGHNQAEEVSFMLSKQDTGTANT